MIIYTQTPDYYNDYLQHGWLKDQAAKVHKYISRKRNAAGKWIYTYAKNNFGYGRSTNSRYNKLTGKYGPSDWDEWYARYLENRGWASPDDKGKHDHRFRLKAIQLLGKALSKITKNKDYDVGPFYVRQKNRGYTNSGSAAAKQSAKYIKPLAGNAWKSADDRFFERTGGKSSETLHKEYQKSVDNQKKWLNEQKSYIPKRTTSQKNKDLDSKFEATRKKINEGSNRIDEIFNKKKTSRR